MHTGLHKLGEHWGVEVNMRRQFQDPESNLFDEICLVLSCVLFPIVFIVGWVVL